MNAWVLGKRSVKHYQTKKIFSHLNIEDITDDFVIIFK